MSLDEEQIGVGVLVTQGAHRAVLAIVVACGGAPASSPAPSAASSATVAARPTTALPASARADDLIAQFAYDKTVALQLREAAGASSGNVAISDVEYANGRGGIARGTLFSPFGLAKRPALLMSPGSNQGRAEMRSEALGYAGTLGLVVLVVDQSQIAASRDKIWTLTPQDREEAIESVVDLLRGVDVLSARTDVDTTRIGIYAFSYGASLAVMAGAADRRVSLLVLRSGGPQILREIAGPSRAASPSFASYLEVMTSVDQMKLAPAIPPSVAVLVQNGSADSTYPADGVRAWQAGVGGNKVARMYDGVGHGLDASATDDAVAFVRERWQLRERSRRARAALNWSAWQSHSCSMPTGTSSPTYST